MKVNNDVLKIITRASKRLYEAVVPTLGPSGQFAILYNGNGEPYITKDGVSIARKVTSENAYENSIIKIIREASIATADKAGDGTTTTILLTHYLIMTAIDLLNRGYNKQKIIKAINTVIEDARDCIYIYSKIIDCNSKFIYSIAKTSTNNDEELSAIISTAFKKVGPQGIVLIDDSNPRSETYVEYKEGTQIQGGFADQFFITDSKKREAKFENPNIVILNKTMDSISDISSQIDLSSDKPLVIIAHDYTKDALDALILNHYKGIIKVLPIRLVGSTQNKQNAYLDLQAIISGTTLEAYNMHVGTVDFITANENMTLIFNKNKNEELLQKRIELIQSYMANATKAEAEYYSNKLAKLLGKVCTIYPGGATDVEIREKKDRIEDAICAIEAALEDGICPGGGCTYYNIYKIIKDKYKRHSPEAAIAKMLLAPIKTLCKNANIPYRIVRRIIKSDVGYDFKHYNVVSLFDADIVDPAAVLHNALRNSASVVTNLINTNCIVL